MNKVLQFSLADIDQAICVSHTSKENTVLRSGLPPAKVFMIPNAVDTAMFKPADVRPSADVMITIVVISRLVYRKGADLLVEVIPEVCRLYPNVSVQLTTIASLVCLLIFFNMFWFVKGSVCGWRGWTKACATRGNEGEAFSPGQSRDAWCCSSFSCPLCFSHRSYIP